MTQTPEQKAKQDQQHAQAEGFKCLADKAAQLHQAQQGKKK